MPATRIVCFETHNQLTAQLRQHSQDLPVWIRRTRLRADFLAAFSGSIFPIAVLEAEADPDLLPELAAHACNHQATVIIVGDVGGLARQMQLRELGVHCVLSDPAGTYWKPLLTRLVQRSQDRMKLTG